MRYRALIFDVDGTLAETEEAHREAFNRTFAAWGLDWHWDRAIYEDLLKTTGGKERIVAWQVQLGETVLKLPEIAKLHAEKTAEYGRIIDQGAQARPGILALMQAARAKGMMVGVATTTSRPNVERLSRAIWGAPAYALFDAVAAGDEVAAKKPAGDVYALVLRRMGVAPGEALALEDSRNGVLAAQDAGLDVAVARSVYTAGDDMTGALVVARSFEDERIQLLVA